MYIYIYIYIYVLCPHVLEWIYLKTHFILQIFRSHFGSFFCASKLLFSISQYFTVQHLIKLSLN